MSGSVAEDEEQQVPGDWSALSVAVLVTVLLLWVTIIACFFASDPRLYAGSHARLQILCPVQCGLRPAIDGFPVARTPASSRGPNLD